MNLTRPCAASRLPDAEATLSIVARAETPIGWYATGKKRVSRRKRSPGGFVLVFDEIQQIPNWSETVKGLWDADRARDCPLRVVILGSAPLLMAVGIE